MFQTMGEASDGRQTPPSLMLDPKTVGGRTRACGDGREVKGGGCLPDVSLIVEGALLPGHGLDGAWHGGRFERGGPVWMEGVANGVDGGEWLLGGQRESVLVL